MGLQPAAHNTGSAAEILMKLHWNISICTDIMTANDAFTVKLKY